MFLNQHYHSWNDNRRRNSGENRAHHGSFGVVNSKNYRGKQNITDDFAGSRNEGQKNCTSSGFFQVF